MSNAIEQSVHGPDPVDIHVGKQLRYLRISRRMSQERLGAMVDLTFQQIQKYEKGTNRVSASVLYRLAQALGVPVSTFFEGLAETSGQAADDGVPLVESLLATAAELQQFEDEEVRSALMHLIRVLARSMPRRTG
ncbi:MAG TPA: helix-turn-helix domain-containing protein [Stellaceae bacterium]|nr:helix-turn-helix domain-containing protein [Stellaceae bacterium]